MSCRTWSRPPPASVATAELAEKFNKHAECDLLFMWDYIVFHLIDRCARWHAAEVIPNKQEDTLVEALDSMWVGIHGPMAELILDGEWGYGGNRSFAMGI